jgi:predicted permease
MGRIDPTLFLSVYLLLYPVLQWGIGGWMLAPPEKNSKANSESIPRNESIYDPQEQPLVRVIRKSSQRAVEHTSNALQNAEHGLAHNVLNKKMSQSYQIRHRGLETLDASLYMSVHENLNRWGHPIYGSTRPGSGNVSPMNGAYNHDDILTTEQKQQQQQQDGDYAMTHVDSTPSIGMDLSGTAGSEYLEDINSSMIHNTGPYQSMMGLIQEEQNSSRRSDQQQQDQEQHLPNAPEGEDDVRVYDAFKNKHQSNNNNNINTVEIPSGNRHPQEDIQAETSKLLPPSTTTADTTTTDIDESSSSSSSGVDEHLCETCTKVVRRCLQPPVVGALLGLFVASFPSLRGIFVDIIDRTGDAPLEWFFDGLYSVGQSAVPINMIILGCNLSASYMLDANDHKEKFFSKQAGMAVVVGKMIVMPFIGYISAYLLQFVYPLPDEIRGSFYLVVLIVFLCPTANNVMVMVELSGNGSKEGMARIIAYQYMVAPIILSLTVTGSVLMASTM